MVKHVKPTKEELEKKVQDTIAEVEALETPEEPEKPIVIPQEPTEELTVEPEVESTTESVIESTTETEAEPSPEEKERLKQELEEKKKKLSASARENQKIYAKNRVINKALIEAEDVAEPTEEELQKEYKDWDVMNDFERETAKETIINRRWRETIKSAKDQATKIEKWTESVEAYISDPKTLADNPELEGKESEFVAFATKEEVNSVPFSILVPAFLHDQQTSKVSHKGKMFETGSGGANTKETPKTNKLSLDESRKLRETDYSKWRQYVKEGKIDLASTS